MFLGGQSFLLGILLPLGLLELPDDPQYRLFVINEFIGAAAVNLVLGGVLVYHAASSLGRSPSGPARFRLPWPFLALFPVLLFAGQAGVNSPDRLPWIFPMINLGIVSLPSLVVAISCTRQYLAANPGAWPLSWREWGSAIIYGAVGATTVAAIINTVYLVVAAMALIALAGEGPATAIGDGIQTLPRGLGIAYDLSVLSVVAPLNEELWKGMIVALFFFRRGGMARCFLWGVLAGAGFNVLETFQNSLAVVHPRAVAEATLGSQWWLFALARAGTGLVHSTATGLAALGFYGVLRRRWRLAILYPAGVIVHGSWNFLTYVMYGDALLSRSGPDSLALDVLSFAGLVALMLGCALLLFELPRRLTDGGPPPIYRLLGMTPVVVVGVPIPDPGVTAGAGRNGRRATR